MAECLLTHNAAQIGSRECVRYAVGCRKSGTNSFAGTQLRGLHAALERTVPAAAGGFPMRSIQPLARTFVAIVMAVSVGVVRSNAQQPSTPTTSDFERLSGKLRVGDSLVVDAIDGTRVAGRLLKVSATEIALHVDNTEKSIDAHQVSRIVLRRNGVLLGALIGAAVGVPFGLALRSYAHNEGGSEALAVSLPILVGLGTGIAVDAFLVHPRTVFDGGSLVGSTRVHPAPSHSVGLAVAFRF